MPENAGIGGADAQQYGLPVSADGGRCLNIDGNSVPLFEFGCGYGRTAAGIFQDMPGFGRKSGQKYDFQPAAVCAG